MRSHGAGGCDFVSRDDASASDLALWSAQALPSVTVLTTLPAELADPEFQIPSFSLDPMLAADGGECVIERRGETLRVHADPAGTDPPAVILPFDRLFEIRVAAALRLWRGLTGGDPGRDPATLSPARRERLILGLRALDGRLAYASYREIAAALFGPNRLPERGWKSHDLRDRTIRLVRFGVEMMQGGYRRLLRHPYRGRL